MPILYIAALSQTKSMFLKSLTMPFMMTLLKTILFIPPLLLTKMTISLKLQIIIILLNIIPTNYLDDDYCYLDDYPNHPNGPFNLSVDDFPRSIAYQDKNERNMIILTSIP